MALSSRRGFLLTAPALCLGVRQASAEPEPIRLVVVVAKTSELRDLPLNELRSIYRGKARSGGGQTLIPFNHPAGSQDRIGFDRTVLHMSPEEVGRYWVDQKIRGGASPPRSVESVALLVRLLAKLPGAIGYVRAGVATPELRSLTLDGRQATDADYPVVFRPV